jgi:hypothetical protein
MATSATKKPSVGDNIIINIDTNKGPVIFHYKVKTPHENFLDVVKAKFPGRIFHISNVKDPSGKRVKGANPPFINRDGFYVFPCAESN